MITLPLLLLFNLAFGTPIADEFQFGLVLEAENKTLAAQYLAEIEDIQQSQFAESFMETSVPPPPSPPVVPPGEISNADEFTVNRLLLFGKLAAASYCMRRNVFPDFKCGSRCSDDLLTLASMVPGITAGRSNENILKNTVTEKYIDAPDSGSVGFVATNSVLDGMQDSKAVIISFRGSLTPKNFYHDLMLAQVEHFFPFGRFGTKLHYGFLKTWRSVLKDVVEGVRKVVKRELHEGKKRKFTIYITGHSLGGAVGTIAGAELVSMGLSGAFPGLEGLFGWSSPDSQEITFECPRSFLVQKAESFEQVPAGEEKNCKIQVNFEIYTYGEPRVGNHVFAEWVSSIPSIRIYRSTYYNDLVVHLPPEYTPISDLYRHHLSEYFIHHNQKTTSICRAMVEDDTRCSRGIRALNPFSHLTYWNIIFGPFC